MHRQELIFSNERQMAYTNTRGLLTVRQVTLSVLTNIPTAEPSVDVRVSERFLCRSPRNISTQMLREPSVSEVEYEVSCRPTVTPKFKVIECVVCELTFILQ